MNFLLIAIIFIHNEISMNFAFTSPNKLVQMVDGYNNNNNNNKDIQLQRFSQNPPSITHQFISMPGHHTNNNPTQSSSVFCQSNPSSYPLKSIVISNIGSASEATLSVPNQPNSIMNTARTQGSLLVFNNPPMSQCYLLSFSSQNSGVNSADINNMQVQFIYDSNNVVGGQTRSIGSNNVYGNPSLSFTPNTYSACGSISCQNGGICQYMGANGYKCQCDSSGQWLGNDCSKRNPCMWSPCNNGGQCYYLPDATYYCVCYSGYSGPNCQSSSMITATTTFSPYNPYNPCLSVRPCLNGGTCLPQGNQGAFTCMCPQGYTGVNCQSLNYFATPTTVSPNACGNSSLGSGLDRIVGGEPVKTYSWPWIVSLQTMSGSHFCGGALIDAFHVVTAAHCFETLGTSPNTFKVVAGILNLRQMSAPRVQQLAVERVIRNERFSPTALVNDITVIKLRTPAQINEAVYPICLPDPNGSQDPKVGQNVRIAGWGYTNSAAKQLPDQLQQAIIQVLDINGDLYGGPGCSAWIRRGYTLSNAQQICAMSRDTRIDSCQGDSGGPLIYNVKSRWYLVGVVSYGDSVCASSTAAGVYTRVSAYVPWIQQKLQL